MKERGDREKEGTEREHNMKERGERERERESR